MADQKNEPISMGDDEPLSLEGGEKDAGSTSVKAFGGQKPSFAPVGAFKRPLNLTVAGATRCRVFHSKISPPSLEYMENQINQWIDSDKIEVKHVGHLIGDMEGKAIVPNVIVVVWY